MKQLKLVDEVVFVFENDHLMERDAAEFVMLFARFEPGSVKYCVGLEELTRINGAAIEGRVSDRRLLIFDEVDTIMFAAPFRFHSVVGSSKCVCFTATPDNKIDHGVEKTAIEALGITVFSAYSN